VRRPPHRAARLGGLVRARPFATRAASPLQGAALSILIWVSLANESENESELPLLEAFAILLMLGSFLLLLFVAGMYWS
jgi:hypothetical protein